MKKLVVIGASGHGKVVADIAVNMNKWEEIYFLDDDPSLKKCMGIDVIGTTDDVKYYKNEAEFFVAIGDNKLREKIQKQLEIEQFSLATLIHPKSVIGTYVKIGIGTIIMAGVVINSATVIGKGSIINTGVTVDHDCIVKDYVHLSPGVNLGGTVDIGNRSWIGIGSTVINNISVCNDCIVGAGSVVLKSVSNPGVYVGIPARRIMS